MGSTCAFLHDELLVDVRGMEQGTKSVQLLCYPCIMADRPGRSVLPPST